MNRNTTVTILELLLMRVSLDSTALSVGINEFDMIEVKILKNGGQPIPGNGRYDLDLLQIVTAFDIYSALGERLKKMRVDEASNPNLFPSL